jgi:TonB family protein
MGVGVLRKPLSWSVLFHALLLIAWAVLFHEQAAKMTHPKEFVWVEVQKPMAHPKARDDQRSHRVVETETAHLTDRAAPDAFLGKHTQTVAHQTVNQTTHEGSRTRKAAAPQVAKSQQQSTPALKSLGVALPAANTQRPQAPEWRLSEEWAPQDYVNGIKQSDRTALNTKEYVFYGYFQRIRQRLDLAWSSALREHLMRIYRGGRQLASDMDHTTRVMVTLNKGGEIVRVQVVEESGTRDLDEAAVRAFNQAGPFPNPPRGIVDANGLIQIRWDFVLKT